MKQAKSPQEIEIKLRVRDVPALQSRLKKLLAREIAPRTYESNTLFDNPERELMRRGQLIRVRVEQVAPKGKTSRPNRNSAAILTYKGPVKKSAGKKKGTKGSRNLFKIREEVEVTFDGGEQMTGILHALGLRPVFRYEKFRTTYVLRGIRNVKVEFDETPVGLFLELEGNVASIDRAARLLGYARSDYMTQTYGSLYLADCHRRGIEPGDMLFSPTK